MKTGLERDGERLARAQAVPKDFLHFIATASPPQLEEIEEAIQKKKRKKNGGWLATKNGRRTRGRPREEHDQTWLKAAKEIVWQRHVDCKTWKQIAMQQSMTPGRTAERTLTRKRDDFAELVFCSLRDCGAIYVDLEGKGLRNGLTPIAKLTEGTWFVGVPPDRVVSMQVMLRREFGLQICEATNRLLVELCHIGCHQKKFLREVGSILRKPHDKK